MFSDVREENSINTFLAYSGIVRYNSFNSSATNNQFKDLAISSPVLTLASSVCRSMESIVLICFFFIASTSASLLLTSLPYRRHFLTGVLHLGHTLRVISWDSPVGLLLSVDIHLSSISITMWFYYCNQAKEWIWHLLHPRVQKLSQWPYKYGKLLGKLLHKVQCTCGCIPPGVLDMADRKEVDYKAFHMAGCK